MTKNALFELIYSKAHTYCEEQRKTSSIIGVLINNIKEIGYYRDSQYEALEVYLWMKEVGKNKKISELVEDGTIVSNIEFDIDHTWLKNVIATNEGLFLYNYLRSMDVKVLDYMSILTDINKTKQVVSDILREYEYSNYLYSLPMGAGKTYFIASCIYIDSYLYDKYNAIGDSRATLYSTNSLVLIPSAKKNSIIYSLASIKNFNPSVIFGDMDGKKYKNKLRINIIDEVDSSSDKLKNKNPNLAKIQQSIVGHYNYNVFIINAEKISSIRPEEEEDFENLKTAQQTMIEKSEGIREILSTLPQLSLYVDEAHHIYDKKEDETQLRKAILDIYSDNMISCICVSGTPYLKSKNQIVIDNLKINVEDIPDTVYYYPLSKGIGNFLKRPEVETISEAKIISEGLDTFFSKYDKIYSDGTCSKVAIYCIDSKHLVEVLAEAKNWCLNNGFNPDTTILSYYSNSVKDAPELPKENENYFHNLDNPTSSHRIILLIGIGTEGWDCKSLTGVILPRDKSGKIFVLQSSCRCLREVDDAQYEKAYICLSQKNKKKLTDELYSNFRMTIQDFTQGNESKPDTKKYPVKVLNHMNRIIKYNNVEKKTLFVEEISENNIENKLKLFKIGDFQNKYSYDTREEKIELGEYIKSEIREVKKSISDIKFIDFAYEIINQSFGKVKFADLLKYRNYIENFLFELRDKYTWFDRHPNHKNIVGLYCLEIAKLFVPDRKYNVVDVPVSVEIALLKWNTDTPELTVSKKEESNIYPFVNWNLQPDATKLEDAFNNISGRNKDRMFNYYPIKTDSDYEIHLIEQMLNEVIIDNNKYELYYNGYTGSQKYVNGQKMELEKFQIMTDVGIYTPDFLLLKLENDNIEKILIIETKGEAYENDKGFLAREDFVKNHFLLDAENKKMFDYIRIKDIQDNNEYNLLISKIKSFFM